MKKTFLLFTLLLLAAGAGFAQETVRRTNYIAKSITERFEVLQSNKKLRQGAYTATFKQVTVAKGNYNNGNRTGAWSFFNTKGKLVQTYNYDAGRFTYLDSADVTDMKCLLENIKPEDKITPPVKIGGSCYGMFTLLYRPELSDMVREDKPGVRKVQYKHIITLNDKGYIVSHMVMATVNGIQKNYTLNDALLEAETTRFTPALVNNKPVQCQVTVLSYSNFYGAIVREF